MKDLEEDQIILFLHHLKKHLLETASQEHAYVQKINKYGFLASPTYRYLHTLKVIDYALFISQREGGKGDVVLLSAIFHDLERFTTIPLLHGHKGAIMAKGLLEEEGIPKGIIEQVYEAIYHHVGQDDLKNLSLEGAILVEADRLDKLGHKGSMVHFMVAGRNGMDFNEVIKSYRDYLMERGRRDLEIFRTETGRFLLQEKMKEQESFLQVLLRELVEDEEAFLASLKEKLRDRGDPLRVKNPWGS